MAVPLRSCLTLHLVFIHINYFVSECNAGMVSVNSPDIEIMRREWLTKWNIWCDDVVFGNLELYRFERWKNKNCNADKAYGVYKRAESI